MRITLNWFEPCDTFFPCSSTKCTFPMISDQKALLVLSSTGSISLPATRQQARQQELPCDGFYAEQRVTEQQGLIIHFLGRVSNERKGHPVTFSEMLYFLPGCFLFAIGANGL